MSGLLHRLSDSLNVQAHHRFCPDCGGPVEAMERQHGFDSATGQPNPPERWVRCLKANDWGRLGPPIRLDDVAEHNVVGCSMDRSSGPPPMAGE